MNRGPFELEYWVREHAARMEHDAVDRRRTNAVALGRAARSWNARRAVGLGLIRAGRRLTGEAAAPAVGAPRPAA